MHDLNLIRVLVSVFETGSVSAAAHQLNTLQPSVSHALTRLRDLTGDPLFRRTRGGVIPTARATQLYKDTRSALGQLESALERQHAFDPLTSKAHFTLALSDLGEMTFVPPIVSALRAQAPGIRLEVLPLAAARADDWLTSGRVDFIIGNLPPLSPEIRYRDIFEERYECLLSANHPRIGTSLSLEDYRSAEHVVVSGASGHWQATSLPASSNDSDEIPLNIVLRLQHFVVLPDVVAGSDLIATLPSRTAQSFASPDRIRRLPLPFESPKFTVRIFWRESLGEQRAKRWMIDTICAALRQL